MSRPNNKKDEEVAGLSRIEIRSLNLADLDIDGLEQRIEMATAVPTEMAWGCDCDGDCPTHCPENCQHCSTFCTCEGVHSCDTYCPADCAVNCPAVCEVNCGVDI